MRLASIATPIVALFLASSAPLDDSPRFAPAEKSTLTKTLSSDWQLNSESASMKFDGKEVPSDKLGLSMSIHEATKVKVTDRYMKVAGGRPLELDRTYVELVQTSDQTTSMPGMKEPQAEKGAKSSALEGKTVRFSWNEKDSAYTTTMAGEAPDATLLKGLGEDLDVRGLLPKADVKEGDTWEVDGKLFDKLLQPGGNLHFKKDGDASKPEDASSKGASSELADNVTGKASCRLANVNKVHGHRIAMITIEADLKTHAEDNSRGEKGSAGVTSGLATMQLEGALLWDLDEGHLANFDLYGKIELLMQIDGVRESRGEKHDVHLEFKLAGDVRFEIVTEQ
jgi:hypothetical protein